MIAHENNSKPASYLRGGWRCLLGLLLAFSMIGLSSCRIGKNVERFDPLMPEIGADDGLIFQGVVVESALPSGALEPLGGAVSVGPGDVLDIEIVETPNTRATVVVMPDGMLHYDLAGGIQAKGLTLVQIERKLVERLQEHYPFPIVSINLASAQSKSYTILGQVNKPGTIPMGKPTTLLDAISAAGGFMSSELGGKTQDIADLKRSIVVRDNKIIPADFDALVREGDMSQNIYIRPGDYIFLPAEGSEKVFVLGAVNRPTGVPYSSRVTVVSALAAARGARPSAHTSKAILLRGSLRAPQAAVVNLKAIMRGSAPNFHLQPGDILWVPKEPWHKLEEYGKVAAEGAGTSIALQQAYDHWGDDDEGDTTVNINDPVIVNDPVIIQEPAAPVVAVPLDPDPDPDPAPDPDPVIIVDP
jgi:polysaccharide export outer membrane protein